RAARHGPSADRSGWDARLPGDYRDLPRGRRLRDADQPARRPELRVARSEGEVPIVAATAEAIGHRPPREHGPSVSLGLRPAREKPVGAIGAAIFLFFLVCGLFAGWLAPHGMNEISPINRMKAPSLAFPLGTDYLGRDQLSRILYGAQLSVIISFCAAG